MVVGTVPGAAGGWSESKPLEIFLERGGVLLRGSGRLVTEGGEGRELQRGNQREKVAERGFRGYCSAKIHALTAFLAFILETVDASPILNWDSAAIPFTLLIELISSNQPEMMVLDVVEWWENNGNAWELWPAWYRKIDNWILGKTGNECKAKTGFQQGHLVFLFHHKVTTISPVGVLVQNHMVCHAVTSVEMNALSPSVTHEHPCGKAQLARGWKGFIIVPSVLFVAFQLSFEDHYKMILQPCLEDHLLARGTVIALMDDKEIKVPKVLLVEDFNAKLSDFRLFKQGPSQEVVSPSRQVNLLPNCSLKPWNFQLIQHICHVRPPLGPSPAGFHSCSRGRGVSCSICGSRLECHENEGESAAASTDQIESPHEENAREKRKSSSSKTDAPLLLDLQVEEIKYVFEVKTFQRRELLVLSTLQWKCTMTHNPRAQTRFQYNRGFILLSIFPPRLFRGPFHAEAVKHLLNTIKDSFTREPGIKVQHANFQASKAVDYGATVRAAILSGDSNYSSLLQPSQTMVGIIDIVGPAGSVYQQP
ncbi:hypothetical protein CK203_114411 [Vitis vinifera]|uniref:Uncharacterized protein n=1 Tax=Vitis vinifera TaxID=29760 RepID=A0A438C4Z8_VITVI|nr:hypothetical protein CK203_114411 [Vitis vinifera]